MFRGSRVLHLFDDEDIGRLNLLRGKQNVIESSAPIAKNSSSEDMWLIHVPFADITYLESIFKTTPLRLDSYMFAFSEDNKGLSNSKPCFNCINKFYSYLCSRT